MLHSCIISIQPAAWFQSFWLTTHTFAAVWFPKSCDQCVQLGAVESMVQDKRSRERCRSWTVLHAQSTSALSCGFPTLQGNAEALDRWGGNTKHRLISYVLSNTSAKNNVAIGWSVWLLYQVKGGTFLRHSVHNESVVNQWKLIL